MFEHYKQPVASKRKFGFRLIKTFLLACALITVSVMIGMFGYHYICGFSWIDSFLNASMIAGGMGPVTDLTTYNGKLFAGAYALFSGIVFLSSMTILITPFLHRFIHKFHVEDRD